MNRAFTVYEGETLANATPGNRFNADVQSTAPTQSARRNQPDAIAG
ncbi:MAG: hypothetical protein ACK5OB_14020 [Pirellula sp.]